MFAFVVADGRRRRRRGTKVAENEGDLSPSAVTHSGPCGSRNGGPRLTDQLEEMRWDWQAGRFKARQMVGGWNGNVRGSPGPNAKGRWSEKGTKNKNKKEASNKRKSAEGNKQACMRIGIDGRECR